MKNMKRISIVCLLLIASFGLLFAAGTTETAPTSDEKPMSVTILAQQPGTSFYAYATTISQMLNETFPPKSKIDVIPRGASVSNPTVLNQGDADVAFGLSYTTVLAYQGDPSVYGERGPHTNILGITGGMHMSYTFVMARKAYVNRTGFTTLEEMMASGDIPRVAMKPQGSVVLPIADTIFKAMGTSLEEIRAKGKLIQGQPSQIAEMLRDGRVDVYIDNVPFNHAGVTEVTLTNDMVFLPVSDASMKLLTAAGMSKETVPAGSYRGLTEDYVTHGTGMVIMAHKDAPEDMIYTFTKTLVEKRADLVRENAALASWDPEMGMKQEYVGIPLHPGAKRYYDERGW